MLPSKLNNMFVQQTTTMIKDRKRKQQAHFHPNLCNCYNAFGQPNQGSGKC